MTEDRLNQLDEASREAWEERAAIAEYDGGLSRKDAEALAWKQLKMMPEIGKTNEQAVLLR